MSIFSSSNDYLIAVGFTLRVGEYQGGTFYKTKTTVPHMGYFAMCEDTEHNAFALWEMNQRAA